MNGAPVKFGQEPDFIAIMQDGVVLVPIHRILESAGAQVDFNSRIGEVYVTHKGRTVALMAEYDKDDYDNIAAHADGHFWPSRTPLTDKYRIGNLVHCTSSSSPNSATGVKTYRFTMPLGFLAKTFGFQLQWDEQNKAVEIDTQPLNKP